MPSAPPSPATEPDTPCPSVDTLFAKIGGYLPADEVAVLDHHLAGCDACGALLVEAGRALMSHAGDADFASAPAAPLRALPKVGDKVGRYLLMDVLGRGAMGVVFAAYDPELDRKVAVKLVRIGAGGLGADAELEARLLGEAQAMARLSHPNVVAVYDIGTVDGGVYLAMDLVVGQTLRVWLAEPRRWRAIIEVFAQAGDGLAAAHEAGIVHRDFKPDNVLVHTSGRVLVTDFGLAKTQVGPRAPDAERQLTIDMVSTRAGTILGTPAYMAPEQLDGGAVDRRADVFAFGASLYEALFRSRPYPGGTISELEQALRRGIPDEPRDTDVPGWVRRVVLKALAGDPAARFQSMPELLQALRADPARRLRRLALPLGALIVAGGAVAFAWGAADAAGVAGRECRAGAARAEGVWSPERRDRVGKAFLAVPGGFGAHVFASTGDAIDSYLGQWRVARGDACDDTYERHEQSAELLDLRLGCLDRRLAETEALMKQFETADAGVVQQAPFAVAGLTEVRVCEDTTWLRARVAPPTNPIKLAQVRAAEDMMATANGAELAGKWQDGLAVARAAQGLAEKSGHPPTQAAALSDLARLVQLAGDQREAAELFPRAIAKGLEAGDDRIVARAAVGYAFFLAIFGASRDEALRWTLIAEAEIARLGGDDALMARVLEARAEVRNPEVEPEKSLADSERAIALIVKLRGPDDPTLAEPLNFAAFGLSTLERHGEAVAAQRRALAFAERVLGPQHPYADNARVNLASILSVPGRYAEALELSESYVRRTREVLGAENWGVMYGLLSRASALTGLGRFDEALADLREALAITRREFGEDHIQVSYCYLIESRAELAAGMGDDAVASAERALAIARKQAGDQSRLLAELGVLRALGLEEGERYDEAAAALDEVEPEVRSAIGVGTQLAWVYRARARADIRAGRPDRAVEKAREASAWLDVRYEPSSPVRAQGLSTLGQALWAAGEDDLAEIVLDEARALFEPVDPTPHAQALFDLGRAAGDDEALMRAYLQVRDSHYPRAQRLASAVSDSLR